MSDQAKVYLKHSFFGVKIHKWSLKFWQRLRERINLITDSEYEQLFGTTPSSLDATSPSFSESETFSLPSEAYMTFLPSPGSKPTRVLLRPRQWVRNSGPSSRRGKTGSSGPDGGPLFGPPSTTLSSGPSDPRR